jgi:hypothetical protein
MDGRNNRMSIAKGFAGFSFALLVPIASRAQSAVPAPAASDDSAGGAVAGASDRAGAGRESPIVAYAYAAHGTEAKTIGIQAYGLGLVAAGQDRVVGGGGAVWGSPLRRLTLVVDGQRSLSREFSPSVAMIVNLYGDGAKGFSLGALGKFKIDGFAAGPSHDEVESEAELGALVSYRGESFYLDANAIAGRGMGDEGETDAEGRLRLGGRLGTYVRLGIDGQVRARAAGPRLLANGRTWDFAAGPQAAWSWDRWYGSFTAGPTTMGLVSRNVGWVATLAIGAIAF